MRVITTWEEAKELPVNSIIYDADEDLMRKYEEGWSLANLFAFVDEPETEAYLGLTVCLPAHVLWTPEVDA